MRGFREVRRGGLGLIAIVAAGCGFESDQSWRPSFKRDVIGRELVAVAPTTVERFDGKFRLRATSRPGGEVLSAGDRLRIVRAIHKDSFVMMPAQNALLATIVGRESFGRVWLAGYKEDPTRISDVRLGLLVVPRDPPAWLDVNVSPPSADAADVATLRAAVTDGAGEEVSKFAADTLVRRAFDDASPDRADAQDAIGDFVVQRPAIALSKVAEAVACRPPEDRAKFDALLDAFARGEPIRRR